MSEPSAAVALASAVLHRYECRDQLCDAPAHGGSTTERHAATLARAVLDTGAIEPSEADVEAVASRLYAAYEVRSFSGFDAAAGWSDLDDDDRELWLAAGREAIRLGARVPR